MPEKRYKRGCGPRCTKCWVNNLKHGNKQAKAYLRKHPELLHITNHETGEGDLHAEGFKYRQEMKCEQSETRRDIRRKDEVIDERKKYARKNKIGRQPDQTIFDLCKEEKELTDKIGLKDGYYCHGYSRF